MSMPRVSERVDAEGEAVEDGHRAGERERQGIVIEMLPRALFVVELGPQQRVVAHLSGHPRRNFVRVMTGDRVLVELSARDRTRGRITSRLG